MTKYKVLLADDDEKILKGLAGFLTRQGFKVLTVRNGYGVLANYSIFRPDLIILDIMMPHMDGFEVCRKIREENPVPIIFLSVKNETRDRITGLTCGSDDYIAKPFDGDELLLRIKAVLRRSQGGAPRFAQEGIIKIAGLSINRAYRIVEKRNKEIELTTKEFELLWLMASYPKRVFTREQLIYQIWNSNFLADTSAVTMLVKRLREKIEDKPSEPVYIKTVRGVGYKFGYGHS